MYPTHDRLVSKINSIIQIVSKLLIILSFISLLCVFFINQAHAYSIQFRNDVQAEGTSWKGIGWSFDGYAIAGERIKLGDRIEMYLTVKETLKRLDISKDIKLDIIIDTNYAKNETHGIAGTYFEYKKRHQIYLRKKSQTTFIHELGHVYQRHYGISLKKYIKEVYKTQYSEGTCWYDSPGEMFAEDFVKYIMLSYKKRTRGECDSKTFSKFLKAYGL